MPEFSIAALLKAIPLLKLVGRRLDAEHERLTGTGEESAARRKRLGRAAGLLEAAIREAEEKTKPRLALIEDHIVEAMQLGGSDAAIRKSERIVFDLLTKTMGADAANMLRNRLQAKYSSVKVAGKIGRGTGPRRKAAPKKSARKAAKKVARKAAKKASRKTARKAVRKTAKKAARKAK